MRLFFRMCLVLLLAATAGSPCLGQEDAGPARSSEDLSPRTELSTGFLGLYNPLAGIIFFEAMWIHPTEYSSKLDAIWSHWGLGSQLGLCPAYTDLGVFLEWMPALFAVLRLRYDVYFHFGYLGEVLSYDTAQNHIMEADLNQRRGDEEPAFGQRIMFQPTLRGQLGPVIFQNQTDASWYDTAADGPYIFNWDYETFTELKDFIIENRTDVLLQLQSGKGETGFMAGPQYTLTYTVYTERRRQRAGVSVYWVPRDRTDKNGYLWIYLASGVNIEAVLEEKSPYLMIAVGGSWRVFGKRK